MDTPPIRLLLADDDKDDCLLFYEALSELPVITQLSTVHDGEQLMQELTGKSSALPNVLFLDLNMPRKNGFECLQEIKLHEALQSIVVVVLSTSFQQDVADRLYDNGAQYYIRKPIEFSQLKNVIQQVLALATQGNFSRPTKEEFVLAK